MQYAYCMHDDMIWHDACENTTEPRVMGYAIRTRRYVRAGPASPRPRQGAKAGLPGSSWRYMEWVPINKTTFPPSIDWQNVRASLFPLAASFGWGAETAVVVVVVLAACRSWGRSFTTTRWMTVWPTWPNL